MKKALPTKRIDTWRGCTPDGNPPVVGAEYVIRHTRKGRFTGVARRADPTTWATVEITSGAASAVMSYNIRLTGEEVTVRSTQCVMTLIEPPAEAAAQD